MPIQTLSTGTTLGLGAYHAKNDAPIPTTLPHVCLIDAISNWVLELISLARLSRAEDKKKSIDHDDPRPGYANVISASNSIPLSGPKPRPRKSRGGNASHAKHQLNTLSSYTVDPSSGDCSASHRNRDHLITTPHHSMSRR